MNANQSRVFMAAFVLILGILAGGYYFFERGLKGCFLSAENMAQRFGAQPTNGFGEFKSLSPNQRAPFVWDLIEHKKLDYIGKNAEDLKALVGESDGSFNNQAYPNYLIEDPLQPQSPWTLVFALSKQETVREAFVWRKSCKE